jgi:copper(I)-binding protein
MTARQTTGAVTTVRARTTTLLAAALLPLALSACGVGLDPQTYRERSTQDAVNANVGDLALRDVAILPPAAGQAELAPGQDALVSLTVVSLSQDKDSLVSVTTSAASSVELVDGTGHPLTSLDVPALASVGPTDFGLVLHGLTQALRPGRYIDLTFTFDRNGRRTVSVPVKVYDTPLPRASFTAKPGNE